VRRTLLLLAVLPFAVGCPDQSASSQAQSARKLDQAMDQMRRAGIGYVPADAVTPNQPVSVADYRQRTLQQSKDALTAAAQTGSPSQRMSAHRLLADVHSSAARHEARRGAAEAAALANRGATLFGYLVAVDRADARAASFNADFTAVLQKLETELSAATGDMHQSQSKLDELKPKMEALQKRVEELKANSVALRAQAETMRREGFTLEGEARYDRFNEADKVQLTGDQADFESQRRTVELQAMQSQADDLQRAVAAAEQKVKLVADVRAQTTQRQADARKLREEAQADRKKAADELMAEFSQVAQAYDQVVVTTFEKALNEQKQAIDQIDLAGGDVRGQDQDFVNAETLGKLLDKVYILSEYASAAADFGRLIDSMLVRARTLMPEHADTLEAVYRQVVGRQARMVEDANVAMTRAREIATQLRQSAPDGSEAAQGLTRQQQSLDRYSKQLQDAMLPSRG
jgi:FtsZ-binding cell division protein ZapB